MASKSRAVGCMVAVIVCLGAPCAAFSAQPCIRLRLPGLKGAQGGRIGRGCAVGASAARCCQKGGVQADGPAEDAGGKGTVAWASAQAHRGSIAVCTAAAASSPLFVLARRAEAEGIVAIGGLHLAEAATTSFTVDALVGGMLAGAVAGAAVDLALYPIDTIKTRMQTKSSIALELSEWRQLYAGLFSSLAGHVPSSAIFFAAYETSKVFVFQPAFGIGSPLAQIIASAVGNVAASTLRVPTEVVKTRMQSGADQGFWSCCGRIIAVDGPVGLFRGYAAFLLRDLPFDTIEFVAYEQLKIAYLMVAAGGLRGLEGWEAALIGAVAGGLTGAVTTPLDTLRARLMNDAGEENKGGASLRETAEKILQEDGWQGLFSGVLPRVVWLSLGGTVFFSSLEAAKSVFMTSS